MQIKPESKEKISVQIVEQHVVEQQLQELLSAICVFNSSAVENDKVSLEDGEESRLLEYKVSKEWFIVGPSCLHSDSFPTKDKLNRVFPSIEASIGNLNESWKLKRKNKVVLKKRKIAERHYIEVTNLSKEILKKFPQAQTTFLKLHEDAQSKGSVHSYLEERYLKEGDLSWGLAAIKGLITQDLEEDNDKANEIRDEYSPLQRAFWCLLAIERPGSAKHKIVIQPARKKEVCDYLRRIIRTLLSAPSLQITPIVGEGSPLEMAKKLGDAEFIDAIEEQIREQIRPSSSSSVQSGPSQNSISSHATSKKDKDKKHSLRAPAKGFFPKVGDGEATRTKPVVLVTNSSGTPAAVNERLRTVEIVAKEISAVPPVDKADAASPKVTANLACN